GHTGDVGAAGRRLADEHGVAAGTVAGCLQGRPGAVDEAAIEIRRDLDGPERLRGELVAVVGLIPDRPELDGGQGRRSARRGVMAVVARAHGLDEVAE